MILHSPVLKLLSICKFFVLKMFALFGLVWNGIMSSNTYITTDLCLLIIYGLLMVRVQYLELDMSMEAHIQVQWMIV